jgi:anti-sigma B factor antagonist
MHITERTINDVTILDLDGRLTIGDGAELLRDTVKRLVSQGRTKVLINLTKVPYIDSGGLGELVHCSVSAKNATGAVKLMGLASKVTDLLAITRLVTVFDTFETELDALVSYGEIPVAVPVRA